MDKKKLVDDGFLDMGVCCPECRAHLARVGIGISDRCIVLTCHNRDCSLHGQQWKRPAIKLERMPAPEPYTDADVIVSLRKVLYSPLATLGLAQPLCEGEPLPPEDGMEFALRVLKWHSRQLEARMKGGDR